MAQLVRAPPCHGGGRGFESHSGRLQETLSVDCLIKLSWDHSSAGRASALQAGNADNPTEAEKRQAAGTLASIEGTNLYDAVVENINGGLEKVAELLGRNEAELATAAVPAGTGDASKEHEAFDMNDFL